MHFKFITKIFYIALIITASFASFAIADSDTHTYVHTTQAVESKKVCMVNDKFMGIDQIPIKVGKKIYYGCCQNCVDKLQSNQNNVRFAKDPLTGEQVDKVDAYIVMLTDGSNKVLYFQSEQNYQEYLKKMVSHN